MPSVGCNVDVLKAGPRTEDGSRLQVFTSQGSDLIVGLLIEARRFYSRIYGKASNNNVLIAVCRSLNVYSISVTAGDERWCVSIGQCVK